MGKINICRVTGKVQYVDRETCEIALRRLKVTEKYRGSAYVCPGCQFWHLGQQQLATAKKKRRAWAWCHCALRPKKSSKYGCIGKIHSQQRNDRSGIILSVVRMDLRSTVGRSWRDIMSCSCWRRVGRSKRFACIQSGNSWLPKGLLFAGTKRILVMKNYKVRRGFSYAKM